MRNLTLRVICGAVLSVIAVSAFGDAPADAQPAKWASRELRFTYMGFTTHYSCEGLRDQVRSILLQLGARKDLVVRESGCTADVGRPEPFPAVTAKFSVLEPVKPAGQESGKAAEESVPAHWRPVRVMLGDPGLDHAGQCELLEQAQHQILPLFTTRNVDFQQSCVPHQLTPAGSRLQAEVLVADQKPAASSAAVPAHGG